VDKQGAHIVGYFSKVEKEHSQKERNKLRNNKITGKRISGW